MRREIVVDSFAGGGGASLGIALALGRGPDVAINHDAAAIEMHAANHPDTVHLTEDVWKAEPRRVTKGRPVGLLWASPDCFPAGTLVLTGSGLKPIETVRAGEYDEAGTVPRGNLEALRTLLWLASRCRVRRGMR